MRTVLTLPLKPSSLDHSELSLPLQPIPFLLEEMAPGLTGRASDLRESGRGAEAMVDFLCLFLELWLA